MVNIVIRCNATHTVPSRVDVRCRNGAFFGVALPIKTDRETVVLSEFCITVFRCSGRFADTLLYIVLIVDNMHTRAGLQMLCGIVEYLISPIVPAIIVMVIGPSIILICERPFRLFLFCTGICTHHTSAVSGVAHGHICVCCGNRLVHAIETPGNLKHSLRGGICLVIPDTVVRRCCMLPVIVHCLVLVDINGHDDLFYRIFRLLSVIALRLLIIVGIVRGEHVRIAAQQIQPCKASVCIALVGFIEDFLSGTSPFAAVCINCCNRPDIILGTGINFQIVCIKRIGRQIQCDIYSCRRIQRCIPHVIILLMLLSGKSRLCLGQIVPCVQILAEVHSERTDGFIADLQLGVIRTISPLLFFREQITVCAVYMLIASPGASRHIFCGLGILLAQMFHCTGCCGVLLIPGTGILIKCHNSGVKIHLGDIDCCGVFLRDDILVLIVWFCDIALGFPEAVQIVVCLHFQCIGLSEQGIVITVKFDIPLFRCGLVHQLYQSAVQFHLCQIFDAKFCEQARVCISGKCQHTIGIGVNGFRSILCAESDNLSGFVRFRQKCYCFLLIICIFSSQNDIVKFAELIDQILINAQFRGMETSSCFSLLFIGNLGNNLGIIQNRDCLIGKLCTQHKVTIVRHAENGFITVCIAGCCTCGFLLIIIIDMGIDTESRTVYMERHGCRLCLILHQFMLRCYCHFCGQIVKPVACAINTQLWCVALLCGKIPFQIIISDLNIRKVQAPFLPVRQIYFQFTCGIFALFQFFQGNNFHLCRAGNTVRQECCQLNAFDFAALGIVGRNRYLIRKVALYYLSAALFCFHAYALEVNRNQ